MTKPKKVVQPTEAEVESALDHIMTRKGYIKPDSEVINSPAISTNDNDIEYRLEKIKHLVETNSRARIQLAIEIKELVSKFTDIEVSDYYIIEGFRLLSQGIEYAKDSKEKK